LYLYRKRASRSALTRWATHFFHLIFLYDQTHFWQFMDLAAFFDFTCHLIQALLACLTTGWSRDDHPIWRCHDAQGMTGMAWLPTGLLLALASLFAHFAFETIARRRLTAVMAIFA
jgi:hypothetical protein